MSLAAISLAALVLALISIVLAFNVKTDFNVIELRDFTGSVAFAHAMPSAMEDVRRLFDSYDIHAPWIGTEGIIVPSGANSPSIRWRIPTGKALFRTELIQRPAFNAWKSPDWAADHERRF